jgi:hypothetical protein
MVVIMVLACQTSPASSRPDAVESTAPDARPARRAAASYQTGAAFDELGMRPDSDDQEGAGESGAW